MVIGEVEKWRRRREFLALKKHRRPRSQHEQRGHGFESGQTRYPIRAAPAQGIGNLIMVLDVINKTPRLEAKSRRAPALLLPAVALALKQKTPFQCGDEFLGRPSVIRIVGLGPAGQGDHGRMMEIIVPK